MLGKIIISQVFALPSTWAATSALQEVSTDVPAYVPIGIWALVSLYVLYLLKKDD